MTVQDWLALVAFVASKTHRLAMVDAVNWGIRPNPEYWDYDTNSDYYVLKPQYRAQITQQEQDVTDIENG